MLSEKAYFPFSSTVCLSSDPHRFHGNCLFQFQFQDTAVFKSITENSAWYLDHEPVSILASGFSSFIFFITVST